ncbi:MAG: hypothetical protein SGPRY_013152 [Prymnesium sp.]
MGEECEQALLFRPWWVELRASADSEGLQVPSEWFGADSDGQAQLQQISRRELLLDSRERRSACCGLVDLLFAYCYDARTTEGEHNVESGWTICRLSSLLSFLDSFHTVGEAATACVRRSLCYPLFRHWELAMLVLSDVATVLSLGREASLHALLEARKLVGAREHGYLLQRIYLDDFCLLVSC